MSAGRCGVFFLCWFLVARCRTYLLHVVVDRHRCTPPRLGEANVTAVKGGSGRVRLFWARGGGQLTVCGSFVFLWLGGQIESRLHSCCRPGPAAACGTINAGLLGATKRPRHFVIASSDLQKPVGGGQDLRPLGPSRSHVTWAFRRSSTAGTG